MSKADKTISEKLEAFEQLVAWFESEDFSLEKALAKYKSAEKLAEEIEKELDTVKNEVQILKTKITGSNA